MAEPEPPTFRRRARGLLGLYKRQLILGGALLFAAIGAYALTRTVAHNHFGDFVPEFLKQFDRGAGRPKPEAAREASENKTLASQSLPHPLPSSPSRAGEEPSSRAPATAPAASAAVSLSPLAQLEPGFSGNGGGAQEILRPLEILHRQSARSQAAIRSWPIVLDRVRWRTILGGRALPPPPSARMSWPRMSCRRRLLPVCPPTDRFGRQRARQRPSWRSSIVRRRNSISRFGTPKAVPLNGTMSWPRNGLARRRSKALRWRNTGSLASMKRALASARICGRPKICISVSARRRKGQHARHAQSRRSRRRRLRQQAQLHKRGLVVWQGGRIWHTRQPV